MKLNRILPPISLPIYFFSLVICIGTVLLHSSFSHLAIQPVSWIDALFTATSATCVTGLAVVDTGTSFSLTGLIIILGLIQVGGLGIMTFTGLFFYLLRRRVSLTDRIAIGQSILHDPSFKIGSFLKRLVLWTLIIESAGAFLIHLLDPQGFPAFSALFHAVSAFCNAGFSLQADSLIPWRGNWGINLVFMLLIIIGGIGFSVILESQMWLTAKFADPTGHKKIVSWYTRVVLKTTLFLIIAGFVVLLLAESLGTHRNIPFSEKILSALFQSVTCRTAGFNTLDIYHMTNVSLLFMMILMFIGGAPGSCAGGIKVTSFRVLIAFIVAQLKGRKQVVIGKFAVTDDTLNRTLLLTVFAGLILLFTTLLLNITEGANITHPETRGLSLEIFFEAISAFGTVGLSTGLTPKLTPWGKMIITILMFVGRLGPVVFLAAIQTYQREKFYKWPDENLLIG
jgi:trk system potassium uptake protein TrkH